MLHLTKKFVTISGRIMVSDDDRALYLTNYHWIAPRKRFYKPERFDSVEKLEVAFPKEAAEHNVKALPLSSCQSVIPDVTRLIKYFKTRFVVVQPYNEDAQLFTTPEGDQLWILRPYVEFFELNVVFAAKPHKKNNGVSLSAVMKVNDNMEMLVAVMTLKLDRAVI